MNHKVYTFEAVIEPVPGKHGAFVRFPYDVRKEFGKGRVKNADGSICYIIGVRKDIQKEVNKFVGDSITVTIQEA